MHDEPKKQEVNPTSDTLSAGCSRLNRTICVPWEECSYAQDVKGYARFRRHLDEVFNSSPKLFPPLFSQGYRMKDIRHSSKLNLPIRRIEVANVAYTVRPSFVMPYNTALVTDVEIGLFFRKFNVPHWALASAFGRDPMFWHRLEAQLGYFGIAQTTVNCPENLPRHLAADEKHTKLKGDKVYVATTVGDGNILGCEVAADPGNDSLAEAYDVFKDDVREVDAEYSPETVNLDRWAATNNAWRALFKTVTIVSCILHVYIKLRDRSKRKWRTAFNLVADKFWNCYEAPTKASFSQRLRRFSEWAKNADIPDFMRTRIDKMRNNRSQFSVAYDSPGCHRTSNMLDRLMQRMDRRLTAGQYFHGTIASANLALRGWCLIQNFAPSNPATNRKTPNLNSPAERLNQSKYHENWLQNLLISASLVRRYQPPPPKA